MRKFTTCVILTIASLSGFAQGSLDALEASRGLECAKIGGIVVKDEIKNFNPYALKSRINEFELSPDGCKVGDIPIDFISVWATDLVIDRVTFLVSKRNKNACFNYLVKEFGEPECVGDVYFWKSPNITLTFRMNPQRSAIKKKGQGLGMFWQTSKFEKTLQAIQYAN